MSDFMPLNKPAGSTEDGWYMIAVQQDVYAPRRWLINDGSHQVVPNNKPGTNDHLFFKNENAAHVAGFNYYDDHNELYPYMEEWKTVMKDGVVPDPVLSDDFESEVMRFE